MVPSTKLKRSLLAVAALTAVVLAVVWLLWPEPAIGPASYERIRLGMTQAEVEAVIGLPPGIYHNQIGGEALTSDVRGLPMSRSSDYHRSAEWWGTKHGIFVAFDKSGAVVGCQLFDVQPPRGSAGLLERIRSWLGW